jgi:hypothetical protein
VVRYALYEYITPIFNVYELELYMKKNSYDMMLSVFDKQRFGDKLENDERKWKKNYNKSREESSGVVDGVKVTRYLPAWGKSLTNKKQPYGHAYSAANTTVIRGKSKIKD